MPNARHASALLLVALAAAPSVAAQPARIPLTSASGLTPLNTRVDTVTFRGHRALRVMVAPEIAAMPAYRSGDTVPELLVGLPKTLFGNGTIELDVAGRPAPDSPPGGRGFVGIAFRVDTAAAMTGAPIYDAVYLRPTNGRADDQERRNHAVQYISHPLWTWSRMRRETPSRYEAYVDLETDRWTHMRVVVRGDTARLYVNRAPQPTLIVTDVKTGARARGGLALWIGPGTVAHFRELVVTPAP